MAGQQVANTLWAVATLGLQSVERTMRSALEEATVRVAPSMIAQNVANTLWALATLGWQAQAAAVQSALEEATVRVAPSMKPQDVANTLWALAKLGRQSGDGVMWVALEEATVRVAPSMNPQQLASTLWAAATLNWPAGNVSMRSALEGAALRVASSMKPQGVANAVWAFAHLGWEANPALNAVCQQKVDALVRDSRQMELTAGELSQLLQAHLASQFLGLGLMTLPAPMLQLAVQADREQARKATLSSGQREVRNSLRRLGISHELEYTTAEGLFDIDLAIAERRIAVEFVTHVTTDTNTVEPLRRTRLRHRLLSAMGWHVVSIPFFEWGDAHQPYTEQMDAYVEQRLLVDPPSSYEM
jgi:hypothetical protein